MFALLLGVIMAGNLPLIASGYPLTELSVLREKGILSIPPQLDYSITTLQQVALADAKKYELNTRQAKKMFATIQCESGWNATSTSPTGDYGVVQINKKAHPIISMENMMDPYWSLDWMAKQFSLGNETMWICYQIYERDGWPSAPLPVSSSTLSTFVSYNLHS